MCGSSVNLWSYLKVCKCSRLHVENIKKRSVYSTENAAFSLCWLSVLTSMEGFEQQLLFTKR